MAQAGSLDRRITLERATISSNGYNEPVATWSALATVWAERIDASAAERYRANEVGAEISTRWTVRFSSITRTLTAKDRLIYDGTVYEITAVREQKGARGAWIEIDTAARDDGERSL